MMNKAFWGKSLIAAGLWLAFAAHAEPVNVNTADAQAIAAALPGIGPAKAKAIVDYRTQHGPFKAKEDLTQVPGIGDATLEKIKADVLLQDAGAKAAPAKK
jgi:competence protein ComEA